MKLLYQKLVFYLLLFLGALQSPIKLKTFGQSDVVYSKGKQHTTLSLKTYKFFPIYLYILYVLSIFVSNMLILHFENLNIQIILKLQL